MYVKVIDVSIVRDVLNVLTGDTADDSVKLLELVVLLAVVGCYPVRAGEIVRKRS